MITARESFLRIIEALSSRGVMEADRLIRDAKKIHGEVMAQDDSPAPEKPARKGQARKAPDAADQQSEDKA